MWERVMKMKIEIRNDKAVVSGYVNAVGRDSRPITDVRGKFVEQIEPGAFRASLERSENVDLLLNHDKSKVYASTRDGSLKLTEDSIGLRAEAVLSDAEMIRKARTGEFRGWSFGMYVGDSAMEERAEGIPRRHVKSLNMFEVSLIDKSRIPCYVGTSVECRSDGEILAELRYSEEEPEIVEEERSEPVDYSAVDDVISELRYGAVDNVIAELRYNPYHDPSTGRFCSGGGGGGGGVLVVEKGQKGKGVYVVPSEIDKKIEDIDSQIEQKLSSAYSYLESVKSKNTENAFHSSDEFSNTKSHWNRTENGLNASLKFSEDIESAKDLMSKRKKLVQQKNEPNKKQPKTSTTETEWLNLGDGNYISKDNSFAIEHSGGGYKLVDTQSNATLQSFKTLKQAKSALSSRSFDPVDSVIEELRSSDPAD